MKNTNGDSVQQAVAKLEEYIATIRAESSETIEHIAELEKMLSNLKSEMKAQNAPPQSTTGVKGAPGDAA